MTLTKQHVVAIKVAILVVACSAVQVTFAAEPTVPEQTVEQEIAAAPMQEVPATAADYAAFGKQIDMQIATCEIEQQAVCVSVVIPFDLFKKAMRALQIVDSSI